MMVEENWVLNDEVPGAQDPLPAAVGFDAAAETYEESPTRPTTVGGVTNEEVRQMNTGDERMRILKMVEDGKITATDGAQLLAALGTAPRAEATGVMSTATGKARWFKVRVTDTYTGRNKVNVTIPMGLVSLALRIGTRYAPDHEREIVNEISRALDQGLVGRIVDVVDESDGEHVEVYFE